MSRSAGRSLNCKSDMIRGSPAQISSLQALNPLHSLPSQVLLLKVQFGMFVFTRLVDVACVMKSASFLDCRHLWSELLLFGQVGVAAIHYICIWYLNHGHLVQSDAFWALCHSVLRFVAEWWTLLGLQRLIDPSYVQHCNVWCSQMKLR